MSRVVLVTGGTAGIGLALAEAFMAQGAHVAVCGRSADALERFARSHADAFAVRCDVTNADDRRAMLEQVAGRFGRLDVLVNNAGSFVERDFAGGIRAVEGIEEEIALNLVAPIRLTAEVLERWPEPEAILFVTSGFALVPPTRAPTYGAAKAGLHAFADALRRQLAPRGTHVMEVLPSLTDTPMNAAVEGRRKMPPSKVADIALQALSRRRDRAFAGPAALLPTLLRVAPGTIGRTVGST